MAQTNQTAIEHCMDPNERLKNRCIDLFKELETGAQKLSGNEIDE